MIRLNYMDNHIWKEGQGFGKKDRFDLALGDRVGNSKANNIVGTKVVLQVPLWNIDLYYHLLYR